MKNKMVDVRNHLVEMMELLNSTDVKPEDLARAKVLSELAQTYTNTVRCEIEARKIAGLEKTLPSVLEHRP